jgi:hypothetical protein
MDRTFVLRLRGTGYGGLGFFFKPYAETNMNGYVKRATRPPNRRRADPAGVITRGQTCRYRRGRGAWRSRGSRRRDPRVRRDGGRGPAGGSTWPSPWNRGAAPSPRNLGHGRPLPPRAPASRGAAWWCRLGYGATIQRRSATATPMTDAYQAAQCLAAVHHPTYTL